MTKITLQCFGIATVVLCSVLIPCGVQAQNASFWAMRNSDKLGLTPDQKTKIEVVLKDVENQTRVVVQNTKLGRDTRLAKLREIKENERVRVNEILTPAQQGKLKSIVYPVEQWRVSGYITPGVAAAHYIAQLDSYPSEYLCYTIRKERIRLSALDANAKPIPNGPKLMLAPNVPDVIKPVSEKGSSVSQVEFTIDRQTAKPGFYTFTFRAAIDAIDAETKKAVKINDALASRRVYVTPQPDAEPALRPGQRFIGTPWQETGASTATDYRDVKSGRPITWREIATRIATLQRVEPILGGNRLTFVLEGHSGQIFLETERQATDLPHLTPLLMDTTVRALKAHYEGKQVWRYGGPAAQCVSTEPGMSIGLRGRLDVPLRIMRIERVYRPQTELAIGGATFIGGVRESAFFADNPLVVILDAPAKGLEFSGSFYWGDQDAETMLTDTASNPRSHCLGLWRMLSDRWDFEREYSLSSPLKAHPEWPAKMRKAVLNGHIVKGMTHEMVAWASGWSSTYGTKSDMLRINDWAYDNIPFQGHVYFKNGRVVSQDWPRLP